MPLSFQLFQIYPECVWKLHLVYMCLYEFHLNVCEQHKWLQINNLSIYIYKIIRNLQMHCHVPRINDIEF